MGKQARAKLVNVVLQIATMTLEEVKLVEKAARHRNLALDKERAKEFKVGERVGYYLLTNKIHYGTLTKKMARVAVIDHGRVPSVLWINLIKEKT